MLHLDLIMLLLFRSQQQNNKENKMVNYEGDAFYEIWNQRVVIHDCLHQLGQVEMAKGVHTADFTGDIIGKYINLIKEIAEKNKDNDVLDRLYFSGLIYG